MFSTQLENGHADGRPRTNQTSKHSASDVLKKHLPDLHPYEEIYRDLHAHPGLSFQESYAHEVIAKHMHSLPRFAIKANIGGYGLIGVLENGAGPTIMLRADTDALPVKEQTGLPYASEVVEVDKADGVSKPVMHACGHDMHIAAMLACATTLSESRDEWSGTLIILFQPAEEKGAGAQAMIDDGLYEKERHACPIPDVVLGQHVMPRPAGTIGTRKGFFATSADSLKVTLFGRGGHASQPHRTIDPVVLAAHIIVRLQSIVAREVGPRDETAVVTVASVNSGMNENIISSEAVLAVDVRAGSAATRDRVMKSVRRVVEAECQASGCEKPPKFERTRTFPFTENDDAVTARLEPAFLAHFGAERYDANCEGLGGSEDFPLLATAAPNPKAEGGKGVPYCYWVFGGVEQGVWDSAEKKGRLQEEIPINHSPFFAPTVQPTLRAGVEALVVGALVFLRK